MTSKPHSKALRKYAGTLLVASLATYSTACAGADTQYELGGHTKTRLVAQAYPDDSIFDDLSGAHSIDVQADLRLNFDVGNDPWAFAASYQLFALYGDSIEYTRGLQQGQGIFFNRFPEDARRLVDLTTVMRDEGRFAAVHRLDRLWVSYTNERIVLRFGRQAISWGNGLFFSPMDMVNPFDPTAIDTEYKTGDDMLYAQVLRENGDDLQAALVLRRDPVTGDAQSDERTVSVKYHGVGGDSEYDILAAVNHDDLTIGLGGNRSIGGAVLRGDIVVADTGSGCKTQLVTNLSYSWTWGGKNVSGAIEYYFSGFGQHAGGYDLPGIGTNPELLDRLSRGELYSIGRHYLAGSLLIEMTPLWLLTPTVFLNAADGSALIQLHTQNSLRENLSFLGSISVPVGPKGTEFGGIALGVTNRYFSTDLGVFAQIAWYF